MVLSKTKAGLLFLPILILICSTFYHYQFYHYPYGVHEWSNAERLSLAFGFYDNGMNFFKPSTFNQQSIGGFCGHEFPLQSYIAALAAQLGGRDSIMSCYRGLDILIFCTGLYALFFAVFNRTRSFLFALIPPAFICASPMFVDYSGSFLHDPAAASVVFMSFLPLMRYLETGAARFMIRAVLLLTLAALMKTSAIIYLAGVLCYVFLNMLRNRRIQTARSWLRFFASGLLSIGTVAAYLWYKDYLDQVYHSWIFPTRPIPFTGWSDLQEYINSSFKHRWLDQYFILPAWVLLTALFFAWMAILRQKPQLRPPGRLALLFLLFLLPVFWMVGHQLHIHDYYVICIFFPLLAWIMVHASIAVYGELPADAKATTVKSALAGTLLTLYCLSDYSVEQRLRPDSPRHSIWNRSGWMQGGAAILERIGISRQEKILVLNEESPNLGLLYFDRKGYVQGAGKWEKNLDEVVQYLHEHKLKIVVCESKVILAREKDDPQLLAHFDRVYLDEQVVVLKLRD